MAGLSIFDPIYLGIDENGRPVYLNLVGRNVLVGGEPGSGKSVLVQNVLGHAALSGDVRLVLLDGKEVELGMWEQVADVFVGPDLDLAIGVLRWLQAEIGRRTAALKHGGCGRSPVSTAWTSSWSWSTRSPSTPPPSASKDQREEFQILLRDVVARGRAVGIPVVGATQRPSADIIPTSLRDIFGYRCAFRCTTDVSSDIILGFGWAGQGYSAMAIAPEDQGIGWLLAEEGRPRRFKAAYLTDHDIDDLVDRATYIRRPSLPRGTTDAGRTARRARRSAAGAA